MKRQEALKSLALLAFVAGLAALGCNSGSSSGGSGGVGGAPPPPSAPPPPAPPPAPPPPPPPPPPSTTATVLVPLYAPPGDAWDKVVQAKLNHPQTTVEAVINAANGPGTAKDVTYDAGVRSLKSAGVRVLGYVDTGRGTRPAADVKAEIAAWQTFYGVEGVFLDAMPRVAGSESYCSDLTAYAKGLGLARVVGDPGADVPPSYVGTVDTIVIYEADGMPTSADLGGHTSVDRANFAYTALSVAALDEAAVRSTRTFVGTLYVTSYGAPQSFFFVPPYLDDLIATAGN